VKLRHDAPALPFAAGPNKDTDMFRSLLLAGSVALMLTASPASAVTFKYAFQGDLKSLDPYTLNESFTQGALGNVYEGLTKRDKDLKIIPGLAEKWEVVDPLKWRFHLRKGVKFADGTPFTADDVLFSLERVRSEGSDFKTRVPADMVGQKVDDHTVEFILKTPNPILHAEWDTWYMLSKSWAEKNNSVAVQAATMQQQSFIARNANGTGAFVIESHEPGVKTVFKKNPNWWNKPEHNLDEVIFTTIKSDATRVAALLSGEVDWIEPVPVQDAQRISSNPATKLLTGAEARTIFLNMDQKRDELLYSNVKGKNPFKDVRVRKALYQAIDIEAIKAKVMRGTSVPSALLIAPSLFSRGGEFKRHPYDVEASKKLLAEAGYPNGFEVALDCPNDRYVNDEAICQAVAAMLARINVKINLRAVPKAQFFARALAAGGYDTSFSLLGWTPGSLDSWNVLLNLAGCRDDKGIGGPFNFGGYCNPKVDALAKQILVETDIKKRDELIFQAFTILHEEVSHLPLHQQSLSWGISSKVSVVQRADNQFLFYWARKE